MQPAEVQHDDDGDENPQEKKEFALRGEIGFAGFVDEFGNVAHGFVDGEIFQAGVNHESESQPEQTEEDAEEQKFVAVHAEEADLRKVGELQIGFAARFVRASGSGGEERNGGSRAKLGESRNLGAGLR